MCEDASSIMYAWGRNAPSTKLPRGTPPLGGGSASALAVSERDALELAEP